MDLQTVLELVGDTGPRSYYLIETFILKLLAKHQEQQGKAFQTHVRLGYKTPAYYRDVDGIAPDGIANLQGPTLIDIKLPGAVQSRIRLMQTLRVPKFIRRAA